jgi:hypothetical protein
MLSNRRVLRLLAPMAIGVLALLPPSSAHATPTPVQATLTLTMSGGNFSGLQVTLGPFTGTVDLTKSGGHFVNMNIPEGFIAAGPVPTVGRTVGATQYGFLVDSVGPNAAGNFVIGQANLVGRMAINGAANVLKYVPGTMPLATAAYLPLAALGLSTTKTATRGVTVQGTAWSATTTATIPTHLSLVTPMRITNPNLPNFPADMTLTARLDIPEPATGIMIAVAVPALVPHFAMTLCASDLLKRTDWGPLPTKLPST